MYFAAYKVISVKLSFCILLYPMKVKDKESLFQITRLFGNFEKAQSKRNGKK